MKKIIFGIMFFNLMGTSPLISGEVTDLEWDFLDDLIVTYYIGSNTDTIINCTAFTDDDLAVGGGSSYTSGGIARVRIKVPTKYQGDSLVVLCQ